MLAFEHVPAQPKRSNARPSIAKNFWKFRYEKEFEQVQDVFELQVCCLVLHNFKLVAMFFMLLHAYLQPANYRTIIS